MEDEIRINRISQNKETKIERPLNGSIYLALILFYISKNKKLIRFSIKYQLLWIIIIPIVALIIIQGNCIAAILYDLHLKLYKIIFLFLGFLSLRQSYLSSTT